MNLASYEMVIFTVCS